MAETVKNPAPPDVCPAGAAAWAESGHAHYRAGRRVRRRPSVVAAAVGLVAALGVGSACASTDPAGEDSGPAPPTPPSAATGPAEPIPETAMLLGPDVGSGYRVSDAQEGDDHGSLPMLMAYCGQTGYTTSDQQIEATRRRSFQHSDEEYVLQEVRRYEPGWAATHQDDLRAALSTCRIVEIGGNPADRSNARPRPDQHHRHPARDLTRAWWACSVLPTCTVCASASFTPAGR